MINEIITADIELLIKEKQYNQTAEFLATCHPAEAAEIIEEFEAEDAYAILKEMDAQSAADIFCRLPIALQAETAELLETKELTELLETLPPDDRVDLAKSIPEQKLEEVLPFLAKKERDEIKKLAAYPEESSGSIMTTDYIAFPETLTVQQAINRIRLEGAQKESISLVFVVEKNRVLSGYATLESLILAKPNALLKEIKKPVIAAVTADSDREEASYTITKYGLIVLPVVDKTGILIGIITHDDAMEVVEAERTEDMERFMAIAGKHKDTTYLKTSVVSEFSRRIPWLVILALFSTFSGIVLQSYESTISSLMLLTFYMPMLTDMGGNTGSQSATVVVRALALKEIEASDIFRVIWKELRVALMLAVILGGIAMLRISLTSGEVFIPETLTLFRIGCAISLALSAQVVSATIIGALLPLVCALFKFDPALVASPALTTIVDITGLVIYFGVTKALLHL